jgi:L-amino acid N-acyltransferase YncA
MSSIRPANNADIKGIHEIYAPFCSPDAHEGFENSPPSLEEAGRRVSTILETFPWLVYEEEGRVLGYAHGVTYQARPSFAWNVAVSVYVAADRRKEGIGKKLYTALFADLRKQGYFNAFATISLPNQAAVALHKSLGFKEVGLMPGTSFKGEVFHDVALYHMQLQEPVKNPSLPKLYSEFLNKIS